MVSLRVALKLSRGWLRGLSLREFALQALQKRSAVQVDPVGALEPPDLRGAVGQHSGNDGFLEPVVGFEAQAQRQAVDDQPCPLVAMTENEQHGRGCRVVGGTPAACQV